MSIINKIIILFLLFCFYSCVVQEVTNKKLKGYIECEYKIDLQDGSLQVGNARLEIEEITLKNKQVLMNLFLSKDIQEIFKITQYIFSGKAKFSGKVEIYNRESKLINSYTLSKDLEEIEIIGGFTFDKKFWLSSNNEVEVRTKDNLLVKAPVFQVGFYPSGQFLQQQNFFIKFKEEDGKYLIDDTKIVVSSFGKVYIKYTGRLSRI